MGYQRFCTKPSEQGSFFQASQNESKQWYAMIKTNFSDSFHTKLAKNDPQCQFLPKKWVRLAQNGSSVRYLHFHKFHL